MKDYYRVMLGKRSCFAEESFAGGYIGTDYGIHQDLSSKLPEAWRDFNREFIPVFLHLHPHKSKIGAGLSCGALWTVSKGIQIGDVVLSPDGSGRYRFGDVTGNYFYAPGENLPHRRPVHWSDHYIDRAEMSDDLRHCIGGPGVVVNISRAGYRAEIEKLVAGISPPLLGGEDVEDPVAFVMEKHLEEFLVQNWNQTELGKNYSIFEEEGEQVGQQYPTDTGPIDILAVSKDGRRLLVVELKKGKASDAVVGQTLRYMGYVQEELAEPGQQVEGVIIALEDHQRIRRALAAVPNISFYRYQISFKLMKA